MNKKNNWKLAAAFGVAGIAGVAGWLVAASSFVPGDSPSGYMGQLEVTNFNLSSGNEIVFKTDFEKQYFTGNLYAYPVGSDGVINTAAEAFDGGAKAHLDTQNYDTGRIIVTMNTSGTGVPFRWPSTVSASTMSASQKTALGASTVLDYIRGDRSNETVGLAYRARNAVLGDIIHSRPFYLANSGSPVVFVGANDGMLHAFDAKTSGGNELWAYVPSMLMANLPSLKADPYVHTYFVDGGLNVSDAVISGATKKVLVSGLGAGGQGLFALDVTSPIPADEAAAGTKVLWEITPSTINNTTSASYSNLGYTYGTPVITKVNSGSGQSAVIVGNGYNAAGASTLYVINVANGALIKAITTGGSASGGLSTPACYDSTGDGQIDYCYAGDIDGKMWKFDLTSTTAASWTASLLYTTSPAQAITMAPSISTHPNGGVMINFATGKMFVTADITDTAIHYVYGVWDGAPGVNAITLTQTLSERSYTLSSVVTRVRTVTSNTPTWTTGAGNHKGWKVALPAGERVIGDTVFTENGRFYFNAYNPTIDNSALTPATPNGENWLMELDYLSGGVVNSPFLDLNGDQLLTNADRIKYIAADIIPGGSVVGDPILTTSGIAVGKFISNGISSHPLLVQLATLNTTLLNQNPDVVIPSTPVDRGVAGGHFDIDIFYGPPPSTICNYDSGTTGNQPTATIVISSTGVAGQPATLGGMIVNGIDLTGPLGVSDFPDGTATTTNTTTIRDKINARTAITGFSASRVSGSTTVTVKAPAGTTFNTKAFTFTPGSTSASSAASGNPTGTFQITNSTTKNKAISGITCSGTAAITSVSTTNSNLTKTQWVASLATALSNSGNWRNSYSVSCTAPSGDASGNVTTPSTCTVTGPTGSAACSTLSISKDSSISLSTSGPTFSGGVAGVAGVADLSSRLTAGGAFSGGTAGTPPAFTGCSYKKHFHEYDDIFNVTGVNLLNASDTTLNLARAIPATDTTTSFKVLVHNQYLSPAVTLSIGGAAHTSVKLYNDQAKETVAANVIANAPSYTWSTIQTLEYNMPLDAFSVKDWWTAAGGSGFTAGTSRVGLHPTVYSCVYSVGTGQGDTLFEPVIPPANTSTGKGTNSTTAGARHNGALTIQLIKASTPASSIELQDASRPEYGWRVKAADYETYVLVEWSTYWHHPSNICYGSSGWTKQPALDLTASDPSVWKTPVAGSDDPSNGSFRATSAIASVVTTVVSNVTKTVTTYADGTKMTVVKTANADGTTTISTTIPDGTTTTVTVANTAGRITTGGDEKGSQAKTGRISWSERLRN